MRFYAYSEAADGHPNEDCVAIRSHPTDGTTLLCALADGQGGQAGAERASRLAVALTIEIAEGLEIDQLQDPLTWYQIVAAVDQAVCDDEKAGCTTLVAFCETEGKLCGASCGDSAAVLLQNGETIVLTDDQHKRTPVGSDEAIPTAFCADLTGDWTLMVMSDGVWKCVGFDKLVAEAQKKAGEELILSLRECAGKHLYDDFSLVVVHPEA